MRELHLLPRLQPGIVEVETRSRRCWVSDCVDHKAGLTGSQCDDCGNRPTRPSRAELELLTHASVSPGRRWRLLYFLQVFARTRGAGHVPRYGGHARNAAADSGGINQARHHLRGGQVCGGKMLLHSAAPATRDHRELDICVRVMCDLLSDARPPPPTATENLVTPG